MLLQKIYKKRCSDKFEPLTKMKEPILKTKEFITFFHTVAAKKID